MKLIDKILKESEDLVPNSEGLFKPRKVEDRKVLMKKQIQEFGVEKLKGILVCIVEKNDKYLNYAPQVYLTRKKFLDTFKRVMVWDGEKITSITSILDEANLEYASYFISLIQDNSNKYNMQTSFLMGIQPYFQI